jgi:flagellar motor switch protein FliG
MKQKGYAESFYECTEEIAKVLEKHFPSLIEIDDRSRINDMVDQEIVNAGRRQHEQNLMDEINGGSK